MKTILKKYYVLGISLIIFTLLALGMQFIYLNNKIMITNEQNIENTRDSLSKLINAELALYTQVVVSASQLISHNRLNEGELENYFQSIGEEYPIFNLLYYSDENNNSIFSKDYDIPDDFNSHTRPWYKQAIEKQDIVYSNVYIDAATDERIITISVPVYNGENKITGVIGGDILLNNIITLVQNFRPDNFGYSFLIDNEGYILAHPTNYSKQSAENINDLSSELFLDMVHGKSGDKRINLNGTDGYISFKPIENTDWTIGSFASLSEYDGLNKYLWIMFFIGLLITLAVFIMFLYLQRKNFFEPLNLLINDINQIDIKKNLSYRIPIEENNLFLKPRNAINKALDNTERLFIQQEEYNEKLYHLSYYDYTTGLYNRRLFNEKLAELDIASNLPIGIIMGDVNGLKLINDSFGHDIGDQLLIRTANIMLETKTNNEIIARIGGDEFAMIVPNTNEDEIEDIINYIRQRTTVDKIHNINLSISFGTAIKYDQLENITDVLKVAEDNMYANKLTEGPSMRSKTIDTIVQTLYEKNPREEAHCTRVARLCQQMGQFLGKSEEKIKELETVGLLHDIGKVAIPNSILEKTGPLTEDEWHEMKRHPEIGYRILSTINEIAKIADYVLGHHERYDGHGYPQGLAGEDIPLVSRIIAIADAYDAMTGMRPYRESLSEDEAVEQIILNAGTQFDPDLAKLFVEKVLNKAWIIED